MTKRMQAASIINTIAPAIVTIRMIAQPGNVQYDVVVIVLKNVVVHGVVVISRRVAIALIINSYTLQFTADQM